MDFTPISFHQHPPVNEIEPPCLLPAAAAAAPCPVPPYPRMIEEAIRVLNEPEGSSKRSIARYIEGAYKDLPSAHSDLLTHCLRRLKENGDLVMVKKSYKLARSENHLAPDIPSPSPPPAASSGTKRGRGRPPKPKPDFFSAPNTNLVTHEPVAEPPPHEVFSPLPSPEAPTEPNSQPVSGGARRRGRPKKSWPEQSLNWSKRSPGRPRKNGTLGSGKSPGRPRKFPVDAAAVAPQPVSNGMKRRGRPQTQPQDHPQPQVLNQSEPVPQQQFMSPPQQQFMPHPSQFMPQFFSQQMQPSVMQFQAEPVVVPYADASAAVPNAPTVEVSNTPRRRGRPPKRTTTPVAAGTGSTTGKRRGRPPKSGGVSKPMSPRKTAGRPLGRRKKVEGLDSSQSVAASCEDLIRKLAFFQSKVMRVVGVLKPFMSESNRSASAVAALQELEGLAAMDWISAPAFTEEQEAAQPLFPLNGGLVH